MATLEEAFELGDTFRDLSNQIVMENWKNAEALLRKVRDKLHMEFEVDFHAGGTASKLQAAIMAKSQRRAITEQSNLWGVIIKQLRQLGLR